MKRFVIALVALLLVALLPATVVGLNLYSEDFEGLSAFSPTALGDAGWLVYGNVFAPDFTYLYGYGAFPAPNDLSAPAFCLIAIGEGGIDQGDQQLVVFSDYNNTDHANGFWIESNVYQEQTIEAGDIGETWVFEFDAKGGNIEGESTAVAFIKTLDPGNGYAITNFIFVDMTDTPVTWGRYSLSLAIDAGLEGQLLQIGFNSTATNYEGSGIFYDNIIFYPDGTVTIENHSWTGVKSLFD